MGYDASKFTSPTYQVASLSNISNFFYAGDGVLDTLILGPEFPPIACVDGEVPPIFEEFGLVGGRLNTFKL